MIRPVVFCCLLAWIAPGQTGRVIGEVQKVDAGGRQVVLKTDTGSAVTASLEDNTLFLRIPPGEKDLSKATRIALGDVQPGDRVLARGRLSADQNSIAAASILVMSKSDLARKAEREREEWQRRGVTGVVTAVSGAEITIRQRAGAITVLQTGPDTAFRRYAPDSVRFADAKPGALADIKTGDQVRALGNSAGEGRYTAEVIVSGSFRTIAGTVIAVDTASQTIRVTDLSTRKPLSVVVNPDSIVRRIPAALAERLARFQAGAGPAAGRAGAPAGHGMQGPPDLGQIIERMPATSLSDLKPGEAVIVSSTTGSDPSRVTAIALVAGVEPLLSSGSTQSLAGWSFEIGMQ